LRDATEGRAVLMQLGTLNWRLRLLTGEVYEYSETRQLQ
jgi:hypothetical protein